jgi:3'-5' exoribonuclease
LETEKLWARDVKAGMRLRSSFLTSDAAVRNDSRGVPYLSLKLVDRTGSLDARMWGLTHDLRQGLPDNSYVQIDGHAHEYRGMLQVKIDKLHFLSREDVVEEDFLPATERDRKAMADELLAAGAEIQDPFLRELFDRMTSDEAFWEAFCAAPAAKAMHHARIGGLLEHSAQCLRIARCLVEAYPVDRDLLYFGAIFHDVGKVRELSWDSGAFAYTTEGRLLGHVVLGERLVSNYAAAIPGFPDELRLRVSHVLLAHQGELGYGSPSQPKTLEALLVHMIDNLDARAAMFLETTHNVSEGGWSHHENPLGRALYVTPSANDGDALQD